MNEPTLSRYEITVAQYFAGYPEIRAQAPELEVEASLLLVVVNDVVGAYLADGNLPLINPETHCIIAGTRNGGIRPASSLVGATFSGHKRGRAVDVYDPYRALAKWLIERWGAQLLARGLHVEDFRWTPSWVHFQNYAPPSRKIMYIPSSHPALAAALPGQEELEGVTA